jgi:hypothetical protein
MSCGFGSVIATDSCPEVVALLLANADLNGCRMTACRMSFDDGDQLTKLIFSLQVNEMSQPIHAVAVACDVSYDVDYLQSFFSSVSLAAAEATKANASSSMTVLVGRTTELYEHDDETLLAIAARSSFELKRRENLMCSGVCHAMSPTYYEPTLFGDVTVFEFQRR